MSDDIRDLVGDDLPTEELARIERVDALLRRTPPPPPEPAASLSASVRAIPGGTPLWTRRRVVGAIALAAALAAVFFGIGLWAGDDGLDPVRTVALEPTPAATGASGLIRLAAGDEEGNWAFELDVAGLEELPEGGYYALWLARDGDYAGTCGTFNVGADGTALVRMSASYRLSNYDEWVVSAWLPGDEELARPWLLRAPVSV